MIVELFFIASVVLYCIRQYMVSRVQAYDKSVFDSSKILSEKFKEGHSLESSIEFLSKSKLACSAIFETYIKRLNGGDNVEIISEEISKNNTRKPIGYLAKVIGFSSKYNQNISEIFFEFYRDMHSAYMVGEERKKELATQSFIIFILGGLLLPGLVVIMSSMFNIEVAFFVVIFLLAQAGIFSVASAIITGDIFDVFFFLPLGVSLAMVVIKYGLGVGVI